MKISIIIVNYNSKKYIEKLLESILEFLDGISYEIIIVDNNSTNRDIEELVDIKQQIKFIFLKKNYGFGYANNRGMEKASGEYYLLLNPDTYFTNDSIKLMINKTDDNLDWGIVGPMVLYPNGNIQESALHFLNIRYQIYLFFNVLSLVIRNSKKVRRRIFGNKEYETDYLFGSCMLIRKDLHKQIKGFDEDYFLFAEEADYCFKTKYKTNYKIIHYPKAQINHIAGVVTNSEPPKRILLNYNSKLIFINKNYKGFYAYLLRHVIILLFVKKNVISSLFFKEEYLLYKDVYKNIISMYLSNSPELNKR